MVTVKELINELLDCDMGWEIEVRDGNNITMKGTKIMAVKPEGLVCLFG